jgi:hypothetical protein
MAASALALSPQAASPLLLLASASVVVPSLPIKKRIRARFNSALTNSASTKRRRTLLV